MKTNQHNMLPISGNLALIYASSLMIAVLMTVGSVAGLLFRDFLYPTDDLVRTFVPNDVVNLFIGLPILVGSMWLTWRGKLIGLLCWTGALFYGLYNYIAYLFALPLSWAFLLHLALTMLSVYTLISLVASIDGEIVQQHLSGAVSEKIGGGILVAFGFLFMVRVIGVIANAISTEVSIAETELAANIADFLISPAFIIGGIQLWKRKTIGYVAGLGLLFQASMLFIGLIIFLLLQPLLSNEPFAPVDVMVIFVMGFICFVPFALFVRGVVAKRDSSSE